MQKAWYIVILFGILLGLAALAIAFPGFGKAVSDFFGTTVLAGIAGFFTSATHAIMMFGAAGFPQSILVIVGSFALCFLTYWAFKQYLWTPISNKFGGKTTTPAVYPTMTQPQTTIVKETAQPTTDKKE